MRILAVIGALAIVVGISAAVFFFGGFYNVAGTVEDPAIVRWALIHVRTASIDRHAQDRPPTSINASASVQAGAKAAARGANREAVGFLEQALAALSHLADSPERSEQAIDLRLDLRPPLLQMGELDRVLTLSQEAEAMAQTLRDESRLARVYTYLANYYYLKGEPELAIEYGERCLRIGETAQDRSLQALARGYLGSSYHAQGRFREAERVLRQNLEALGGAPTDSATIQNHISFVTSAAWVAFTHADLGDFDAAFEDLDQAARAPKDHGHP